MGRATYGIIPVPGTDVGPSGAAWAMYVMHIMPAKTPKNTK